MKPENVQAAIHALRAYGEAARGDYYDLTGKDIQNAMREIANVLESSGTYTAEELIENLGITEGEYGYEWA